MNMQCIVMYIWYVGRTFQLLEGGTCKGNEKQTQRELACLSITLDSITWNSLWICIWQGHIVIITNFHHKILDGEILKAGSLTATYLQTGRIIARTLARYQILW